LATVITNLISAIPWIGQSLVEFKTIIILWIMFIILYTYSNMPNIGHIIISMCVTLKLITDKRELKIISYEFISIFIGLIDGDGYFSITEGNNGSIRI